MSLFARLFARKSVADLNSDVEAEGSLHRALGPYQLSGIGIGAIIGAGIFVMTGRVAAVDAGPAVIVSYVIAAIACLFAALCYAEFAAAVPVAGSAYTYAYASLGELMAWIIGWDLILEYGMSCATVASAWSEYLNEFLWTTIRWRIPAWLCGDPFTHEGAWLNLPAVLIMLFVTTLLVRGIRESAAVNALFVVVKLIVVVFVIVIGVNYIDPDNWTKIPVDQRIIPVDPGSKWGMLGMLGADRLLAGLDDSWRSPFMPYGLSGMMLGSSLVFFAFIGFDAVSTHAEEARNPQRDVPIGVLASLIVCTLLYIGVATIITGMMPYPQIDQKAAVASAFRLQGEATGSNLLRGSAAFIALGALAGMTSVLLITFQAQTRVFLAMARDRLLPPSVFAAVHPRFRTPHICTILTGGIVSCIAAFTPIGKLEEMVNIGTLLAFAIVCGSVLVMRIRHPEIHRPFRTPLVWLIAPAGLLTNVGLMLFLPPDTWLRLVVWLVIGLFVYFTYGYSRSRLANIATRV